jgi:hypothetical protein
MCQFHTHDAYMRASEEGDVYGRLLQDVTLEISADQYDRVRCKSGQGGRKVTCCLLEQNWNGEAVPVHRRLSISEHRGADQDHAPVHIKLSVMNVKM